MAITFPIYTTRETVKRALDQGEVAKNNRNIDRAIESASRRTEGLCHRRFYPLVATYLFGWPNRQGARPWRLWLDDTELISVTTLSSGGTTISSSDFFLEPNRTGPPFNRLEISTASAASFGGGDTHQQNISIEGLWGYSNEELTSGEITEALDASETGVDVDATVSVDTGVGSIIRVNDERMLVTERVYADTGETVGGSGLTASKGDNALTVSDGTQFVVDELIRVDSERMYVTDINSNVLTVIRGDDGSQLASHASGTEVFAPRTLTVERGALGTTAATHSSGDTVLVWKVPPGVKQLVTAEAIHEVMQEQTGWFRTMSASSIFGGTARRSASQEALVDLREQVVQEYGRKARQRTV